MSSFEALCSVLEEMDPETYNDLISKKTVDIITSLSEVTHDGVDGVAIYCDFVLCSVAADGVLTEEEFILAKPVLDLILETDIGYEDALEYFHDTGLDSPEGYKETMDAIVDMLGEISPELKDDIILVCMMVCAVDGMISEEEKAWIRQLIE